MKKIRNSDWLRAVQLIPNSRQFCACYQCKFVLPHFGVGKKPSRQKTDMAAKHRRKTKLV